MPRVNLVEKDQANPITRDWYEKQEAHGYQLATVFKVMGHCPYIGLNFMRMGNSIRRGEELPATLRELAIIRVGYLTQAKYEFASHTRIGLEVGVRQKQIDEISNWATSAEFSEEERAVLAYTDEVTQNIRVKDETFAKLHDFFSDHTIVELTTAIGYYCMTCRILVALQIED